METSCNCHCGSVGSECKETLSALCEPVVHEPEDLAEYAPGERKWDTHKLEAVRVEAIYAGHEDFSRRAERMHRCAENLHYAWVRPKDAVELRFKLKSTWFCRVRLCPICQWRRSQMWYARFLNALPGIEERFKPSGVSFIYLTATVRNPPVEDLRSTLKDMGKAWMRFTHRIEFARILGWIRTTEVTYSDKPSAGSAHPHFHVLMMVRNSWFQNHYVTQQRWQRAWKKSNRLEYNPQLRVNKVWSRAGELEKAVLETFKYSVKPSDAIRQPDWFVTLSRQIDRLRFVNSGGVLKDVLKEREKEKQEDLLQAKGLEGPEEEQRLVSFAWKWVDGRYKRVRWGVEELGNNRGFGHG
jgi:plasmid rolling circle replication initiator protein Rep